MVMQQGGIRQRAGAGTDMRCRASRRDKYFVQRAVDSFNDEGSTIVGGDKGCRCATGDDNSAVRSNYVFLLRSR